MHRVATWLWHWIIRRPETWRHLEAINTVVLVLHLQMETCLFGLSLFYELETSKFVTIAPPLCSTQIQMCCTILHMKASSLSSMELLSVHRQQSVPLHCSRDGADVLRHEIHHVLPECDTPVQWRILCIVAELRGGFQERLFVGKHEIGNADARACATARRHGSMKHALESLVTYNLQQIVGIYSQDRIPKKIKKSVTNQSTNTADRFVNDYGFRVKDLNWSESPTLTTSAWAEGGVTRIHSPSFRISSPGTSFCCKSVRVLPSAWPEIPSTSCGCGQSG